MEKKIKFHGNSRNEMKFLAYTVDNKKENRLKLLFM